MNYKYLAIFLGLLSTSLYASQFDGAYVGGGLGLSTLNTGVNESSTITDINTPDVLATMNASNNFSTNFLAGNLFVGYGKVMQQRYYIGAELGWQSNTPAAKTNGAQIQNSAEIAFSEDASIALRQQLNLGVLAGILTSPNTLFYLRVDSLWAQLNGVINDKVTNYSTTPPQSLSGYSFNDNKNLQGVGFGAGAWFALNNHFSIRGQVGYSMYSKTQISNVLVDPSVTGDTFYNHLSITPSQLKFTVDMAYRF